MPLMSIQRFFQPLCLWSVAVTQPLLEILGRSGDFFVAHHASRIEILLFLILLCLLPGVLLGGIALLHRYAALALNTLLLGMIVLQPLHHLLPATLPGLLAVTLALIAGGALAHNIAKSPGIGKLLAWGAVLALIFPALLILNTPVRGLMLPNTNSNHVSVSQIAAPSAKATPVIILVLDELPMIALLNADGQLDAERFPSFGRLASTSTLYPHTHSVSNSTLLAVPAILSGQYPSPDDLPTFTGLPRNLFTLFDHTHRVHAIESRTQLCPPAICNRDNTLENVFSQTSLLVEDALYVYLHLLLPADFTTGLPDVSNDWLGFQEGSNEADDSLNRAEKAKWAQKQRSKALRNKNDVSRDRMAVFERFLGFIPAQKNYTGQKPPLFFLHLVLPHSRYNYTPACVQYSNDTGIAGMRDKKNWGDNERGIIQSQQRHHWQILCTDKTLGRLLDHLEKTNWLNDSLLIVTADHGVSFRKNDGRRMFTDSNIVELMDVPLFIKLPQQNTGSVNLKSISIVDILPTLAELLEAHPPDWQPEGRSILKAPDRVQNKIFDKSWEQREYPFKPQLQQEAVALRTQRLGSGGDFTRMYQTGPYGHWVGKPVSQLPQGPAKETLTHRFMPSSTYGYFLMRGEVTSTEKLSAKTPPQLAVAINGVLWAAYPYIYARKNPQQLGFSTLLPEEVLAQNPKPALTLYAIEDGQLRAIPKLEKR